MRTTALLLLIPLFLGLHCKSKKNVSEAENAGAPVEMEMIASGSTCGVESPKTVAVRSQAEWDALWREVGKYRDPAPEQPRVNFEAQTLLAAFMGTRNNGGYKVNIASANLKESTLFVQVVHAKPAPECMVTMAITQPYYVVAVEKSVAEKVEFMVEERVYECN